MPLQQSEALIARLKACNVTCDLIVRKGKGHFWIDIGKDLSTLADWFDKHRSESRSENELDLPFLVSSGLPAIS